jgi:hypothetical protein
MVLKKVLRKRLQSKTTALSGGVRYLWFDQAFLS